MRPEHGQALDDEVVVMSALMLAAAAVGLLALIAPGVDHGFAAIFASVTALTALYMS